ncbi:hypothetical protein C8R43DRAFT_941786 [Mycena crocata]|nr:hypothetical protein C8R43DRAFT_941786 [Mycena crocata]
MREASVNCALVGEYFGSFSQVRVRNILVNISPPPLLAHRSPSKKKLLRRKVGKNIFFVQILHFLASASPGLVSSLSASPMSTPRKPRYIYPPTYWRDFHLRRRRSGVSAAPHGDFLLGPLQDQAPILTFTKHRVAPLVSIVQNNGTLATSGPTGPLLAALPASKPIAVSRVAQRAKKLLAARPTADELLLAQLAAGPSSRKRKAPAESQSQHSTATIKVRLIWALSECLTKHKVSLLDPPSHDHSLPGMDDQRGALTNTPQGVSFGGGYTVSDPAYAAYIAGREERLVQLTLPRRLQRDASLQRGERFSDMDYVVLSALSALGPEPTSDSNNEEHASEVDYDDMPGLETPPSIFELVACVPDRLQRRRLRRELREMRRYCDFFKTRTADCSRITPVWPVWSEGCEMGSTWASARKHAAWKSKLDSSRYDASQDASGSFEVPVSILLLLSPYPGSTDSTDSTMSSSLNSSLDCTAPVFSDPGMESSAPARANFYWYLVMGREVQAPGAYRSWASADAQYKRVSGASLKGYDRNEWPQLAAAWRASCERGEHRHASTQATATLPATPQANARLPTAPQANARHPRPNRQEGDPPRYSRQARLATGSPARAPTSPLRTVIIESRSPSPQSPPRRRAYAVRTAAGGEIFDSADAAAGHFRRLVLEGKHPVLAVRGSVSTAIDFIEEDVQADPPPSSSSSDGLTVEEERALALLD